eukprot:g3546.t1
MASGQAAPSKTRKLLLSLQKRSAHISARIADLYASHLKHFEATLEDSRAVRTELAELQQQFATQAGQLELPDEAVVPHIQADGERPISTKLASTVETDGENSVLIKSTQARLRFLDKLVVLHDIFTAFDGLLEAGQFALTARQTFIMTKTLEQLVAMRDVPGKFEWPNVITSRSDSTVSSSSTPLNDISHVGMRPSGMQIMDIVRLEISRKRARLSTRLEELFADTFITILHAATSDASRHPESSKGTNWSRIQFSPKANDLIGSREEAQAPTELQMSVDEVIDRVLIVLDFIEEELCHDDGASILRSTGDGGSEQIDENAARTPEHLGRACVRTMGEVLWSSSGTLSRAILDVLGKALPDDEKLMPQFDRVVQSARRFESRLLEAGWLIPDSNNGFAAFVSNADDMFIKKRRTSILVKTRRLLLQDYHNSVVIGAGDGHGGVLSTDVDAAFRKTQEGEKTMISHDILVHSVRERTGQAFRALIDACVQEGTNIDLYETTVTEAQRRFGSESFPCDDGWAATARARANETISKLEVNIKNSKINSMKESIRVGQNDLGRFLIQCGKVKLAMRVFQKNKDYTSTAAHMLEYARNLIACAIYSRAWGHASNHVAKLQLYLRKESNSAVKAGFNALNGLIHFEQSNYNTAAGYFLQTSLMLGKEFSDIITLQDVALYGGICALASFSRVDIDARVLCDSSFRDVLELDPKVFELVSTFQQSDYSASFRCLASLENRAKADIHLAPHWEHLTSAIRSRAILQYFLPYTSVSMSLMATALGTSVEDLELECAKLINEGQLIARIDSHNKVLRARENDSRALTFQKVMTTGDKFVKNMRSTLLGLSLLQHGFSHTGGQIIRNVTPMVQNDSGGSLGQAQQQDGSQ